MSRYKDPYNKGTFKEAFWIITVMKLSLKMTRQAHYVNILEILLKILYFIWKGWWFRSWFDSRGSPKTDTFWQASSFLYSFRKNFNFTFPMWLCSDISLQNLSQSCYWGPLIVILSLFKINFWSVPYPGNTGHKVGKLDSGRRAEHSKGTHVNTCITLHRQ